MGIHVNDKFVKVYMLSKTFKMIKVQKILLSFTYITYAKLWLSRNLIVFYPFSSNIDLMTFEHTFSKLKLNPTPYKSMIYPLKAHCCKRPSPVEQKCRYTFACPPFPKSKPLDSCQGVM